MTFLCHLCNTATRWDSLLVDFKNRTVAAGKNVYKLITATFSLISYPLFLAASSFTDKLSKINSHISLNKIWIISMMKGGRVGGGGGKGGMEAVVLGHGPHPTTTLPSPLHLDNIFAT